MSIRSSHILYEQTGIGKGTPHWTARQEDSDGYLRTSLQGRHAGVPDTRSSFECVARPGANRPESCEKPFGVSYPCITLLERYMGRSSALNNSQVHSPLSSKGVVTTWT